MVLFEKLTKIWYNLNYLEESSLIYISVSTIIPEYINQ